MPPSRAPGDVTIAVLTFLRNEQLARLVPALLEQTRTVSMAYEILIIDNDPAGGARATARHFREANVRYVHEIRQGVAAARNCALTECGSDLLVFIDDDEEPLPGWLGKLVAAWENWRCAAVAGPVISRFEGEPSAWVRATGVFDRTRPCSGTRLRSRGAGNLLLDMRLVRQVNTRFDERFGLTGGEDTMFTRALTKSGHELRWCDEAAVVELVPSARLTPRWAIERTFRAATVWSAVELTLTDSVASRMALRTVLTARSCLRLLLGCGLLLRGTLSRDPRQGGRGAASVASAAGMLLGAYGLTYRCYGSRDRRRRLRLGARRSTRGDRDETQRQ